MMQICTICKQNKPLTDFSPLKTRKLGVRSACRECQNRIARIRRNGEDKYQRLHFPDDGVIKKCTYCLKEKDIEQFQYKGDGSKLRSTWCRECTKEYRAKKADHIKTVSRNRRLKREFNITPDGYDNILKRQNGKCAICGNGNGDLKREGLFIDHNHDTGVVRGLLCGKCNVGIGHFQDNPKLLKRAIEYLTVA